MKSVVGDRVKNSQIIEFCPFFSGAVKISHCKNKMLSLVTLMIVKFDFCEYSCSNVRWKGVFSSSNSTLDLFLRILPSPVTFLHHYCECYTISVDLNCGIHPIWLVSTFGNKFKQDTLWLVCEAPWKYQYALEIDR